MRRAEKSFVEQGKATPGGFLTAGAASPGGCGIGEVDHFSSDYFTHLILF
jgi:hypothetical protein